MPLRYFNILTIRTFEESINCLAFSSEGCHIAAGCDDGVIAIIDVDTGDELLRIVGHSAVTALLWHPSEKSVVYSGFADGRVIAQEVRLNNPDALPTGTDLCNDPTGPVESLDYAPGTNILAFATGSKVAIWGIDNQPLYLPDPPSAGHSGLNVAPRSLKFVEEETRLVVSYLEHGIVCWNVASQTVEWQFHPETRIGRSAMAAHLPFVLVSNLSDGFDLYDVKKRAKVKSHVISLCRETNVPLPVLFIHDDADMLLGSSTGVVQVVDVISPIVQNLCHPRSIVQALAYIQRASNHYIATGSSETGSDTYLKIWRATEGRTDSTIDTLLRKPANIRANSEVRDHNELAITKNAEEQVPNVIQPVVSFPPEAQKSLQPWFLGQLARGPSKTYFMALSALFIGLFMMFSIWIYCSWTDWLSGQRHTRISSISKTWLLAVFAVRRLLGLAPGIRDFLIAAVADALFVGIE